MTLDPPPQVPLLFDGAFKDVLEALIVFVSSMVLLLGLMTMTWRIYQHLDLRRLRQVSHLYNCDAAS